MITIVEDIVNNSRTVIETVLPTYSRLSYEYDLEANNFQDSERANMYGFIPLGADFLEGRTMGSVTMDHVFQLILTTDYNNQDSDSEAMAAILGLYESGNDILKEIAKRYTSISPNLRIIRPDGFDDPEFLEDNTIVALRLNLVFNYSYRK